MDLTKLPVAEAIVGFLIVTLLVTFGLAYTYVDTGTSPAATSAPTEAPTTPAGGDGGVSFDVSMGDNFFDPNSFTVAAGAAVTFNLTNNGVAIHNMRVAGEDGVYNTDDDTVSDPDLVLGGGTATLVWTVPDATGEIIFRCDFHPIEMIGTITVQ